MYIAEYEFLMQAFTVGGCRPLSIEWTVDNPNLIQISVIIGILASHADSTY